MQVQSTRTDQQKITMAPIEVQFGEKKYQIHPLRMNPAQKWREKLIGTVAEISKGLGGDVDGTIALVHSLAFAFLKFPDKMLELILAYAPDLPREEISNDQTGATDEQLSAAFARIMEVAFPFVGELKMMTAISVMASDNFPALASVTKSPSANGTSLQNT